MDAYVLHVKLDASWVTNMLSPKRNVRSTQQGPSRGIQPSRIYLSIKNQLKLKINVLLLLRLSAFVLLASNMACQRDAVTTDRSSVSNALTERFQQVFTADPVQSAPIQADPIQVETPFRWAENSRVALSELTDEANEDSQLGGAIAIDGDRMVVISPTHKKWICRSRTSRYRRDHYFRGAVYAFRRDAEAGWVEDGVLEGGLSPFGCRDKSVGSVVDIAGDYVVTSGAHVWRRGAGGWSYVQELRGVEDAEACYEVVRKLAANRFRPRDEKEDIDTTPCTLVDGGFGADVSIDGECRGENSQCTILVGAPKTDIVVDEDTTAMRAGRVVVYELEGGEFKRKGTIESPTCADRPCRVDTFNGQPLPPAKHEFGARVSISGDVAVIGSSTSTYPERPVLAGDYPYVPPSGYVAHRVDGVWQKPKAIVEANLWEFVDIQVDVAEGVAIFGSWNSVNKDGSRVWIFSFDPANPTAPWAPVVMKYGAGILDDGHTVKDFGRIVAASGNSVFVGAPWHAETTPLRAPSGLVVAYRRIGRDSWSAPELIQPCSACDGWRFGQGIAAYQNQVVIGAPGLDYFQKKRNRPGWLHVLEYQDGNNEPPLLVATQEQPLFPFALTPVDVDAALQESAKPLEQFEVTYGERLVIRFDVVDESEQTTDFEIIKGAPDAMLTPVDAQSAKFIWEPDGRETSTLRTYEFLIRAQDDGQPPQTTYYEFKVNLADTCGDGDVQPWEDCEEGPCCWRRNWGSTCRFVEAGRNCGGKPEGACALQSQCSGTSAQCQPRVKPAGTLCGAAAAGSCDAQDTCDGISTSCPDAVVAEGAFCNDGDCDTHSDRCDGVGRCTGVTRECPPDTDCIRYTKSPACGAVFCEEEVIVGASCDDGLDCTSEDTCQEHGQCVGKSL